MLSLSFVSQRKHNGQHGIRTKFQEYFCPEGSIKENSGQLTVSEVQLSSFVTINRVVYSLLFRQPGKSFNTEQVRTKTISKRLFFINCISRSL